MAEVMQIHQNEEDTQRVYSVDDVCEGKSGIVVADRQRDGWALSIQEPPALTSGEETSCKQAVMEHFVELKRQEDEAAETARQEAGATAASERLASSQAARTAAAAAEGTSS